MPLVAEGSALGWLLDEGSLCCCCYCLFVFLVLLEEIYSGDLSVFIIVVDY